MTSSARAFAPFALVLGAIALVGFAAGVPVLWLPLLAFGFAACVMVETQQRGRVSYPRGWWRLPLAWSIATPVAASMVWLSLGDAAFARGVALVGAGFAVSGVPRTVFGAWGRWYGGLLALYGVLRITFLHHLDAGFDALAVGGASLLYALLLRLAGCGRTPVPPAASDVAADQGGRDEQSRGAL
ncbi:MAG: hypothetical protein KGM44_06140 [bacterium]|nr:hypothetical protein [bacterium]